MVLAFLSPLYPRKLHRNTTDQTTMQQMKNAVEVHVKNSIQEASTFIPTQTRASPCSCSVGLRAGNQAK